MRNLVPFPDQSFPLFEDAVDRKTDLVAKENLTNSFATLQVMFEEYDQLFNTNSIETIATNNVHIGIRTELLGMYSYDNVAVSEIRRQLSQLQPKTVRYTCQYCSFESIEEMDHIVGQREFPEFTLHPKNLAPICSYCNRKKGQYWRVNNLKSTLNIFLDILPTVRYLFLNVFVDQYNELDFDFQLNGNQAIADPLWQLIQRHFTKLELLSRMKKEAIKYFTEFQLRLRNQMVSGQSIADITQVTISTATDIRQNYGANHWKAVFEEGLIVNPLFWNTINQP
ncbi:MAG: hypothetical protein EOO42_00615 [Flavobacteriales bacterium]|nr:MAG: hypothetical protein EOO42_00615 [Flavobacteriales bacterium]